MRGFVDDFLILRLLIRRDQIDLVESIFESRGKLRIRETEKWFEKGKGRSGGISLTRNQSSVIIIIICRHPDRFDPLPVAEQLS